MRTLTDGTPLPLSYIERRRQAAAVPGRGGQVPTGAGAKGTDMRTSRVMNPPAPHYPVSRVAVTGGALEGARGTPAATTSRAERNRIQRKNRAILRRRNRTL